MCAVQRVCVQDCTGLETISIVIYCDKPKQRAKLAALQDQEATPICEKKNGTNFFSCPLTIQFKVVVLGHAT